MCCPVGIFEEFIAVFEVKMSQLTPKATTNSKFSNFQRFYAFFVEVSTEFVNWKILKGQQGKGWLSSTKNDKEPKFSNFQRFHLIFFSNF